MGVLKIDNLRVTKAKSVIKGGNKLQIKKKYKNIDTVRCKYQKKGLFKAVEVVTSRYAIFLTESDAVESANDKYQAEL